MAKRLAGKVGKEVITRRFKNCWISSSGYQMISVNGKVLKRAHFIWRSLHPNDPIMKREIIHHKDENKRNDKPRNLEKMTKVEHDRLHTFKRQPLLQWKKEHPLKAKVLGIRQLNKYRKEQRNKFIKTVTNNIMTWREKSGNEKIRIGKAVSASKRYHKNNPEHSKKAGQGLLKWRKDNPVLYAEMEQKRLKAVRRALRRRWGIKRRELNYG